MPAPRTQRAPGLKAAWLSALPAFNFEFGEKREAPDAFRLFRAGVNVTDKGDFVFDEEAATSVMDAWRAKGDPLMADYEHMSLAIPPQEAPASATEFVPEVRNGELWATQVKWTDRAREYLEAGEYRMFSPAFLHDQKTGRILKLINFALTNNPATHHLEPLVAASATREEPIMEKEQCTACSALSAQLKAFEEKCSALTAELTALKASDKEKTEQMSAATALRSQVFAITGKANEAEAVGVLGALKIAHEKLTALEAQVATERSAKLSAEFNGLLDQASKDGKIMPAGETQMDQRGYWDNVAKTKGVEEAIAGLKGAIPVLPVKNAGNSTNPAPVTLNVSALQTQVLDQFGINRDAFRKAEEARLAAGK